MGFWTRLKKVRLLQSTKGSLTAEAAIGMGALMFVAVVLLQSIGVVLAYLQLQVTGFEAFRILSASGDFETRKMQALNYLHEVDEEIEISINKDMNEVKVHLSRATGKSFGFLPNRVEVSIQGLLLDAAVW